MFSLLVFMSTLLLYFSISCFGVRYSYKASSMNSLVVRFESTLPSLNPLFGNWDYTGRLLLLVLGTSMSCQKFYYTFFLWQLLLHFFRTPNMYFDYFLLNYVFHILSQQFSYDLYHMYYLPHGTTCNTCVQISMRLR